MAFNVSYYDLLNKNIRHIYSCLPSNIRFRCDPEPGVTLNPHDGCLTPGKKFPPRPKPMPKALYRRLWAYSPVYNTNLPRAPAFRCVNSSEAQEIVERVSQMTKTHHRRRRSFVGSEGCNFDDGDDDDSDDESENRSDYATTHSPTGASSRSCSPMVSTSRSRGSSRMSSSSSRKKRCQSVAEMRAITARAMRPTTAWNIRSDLREGSTLDPVEVVHRRSARPGRRGQGHAQKVA